MMKGFTEFLQFVFSFGTLVALGIIAFIYVMLTGADRNNKAKEYCLTHAMVSVRTDAGPMCIEPINLVPVP